MSDFIYPIASLIAGVDEVGRGPLVGAVVTAAVILDPAKPIVGLADSKKLSEKRRLALYDEIKEKALSWSLGRAEPEEIDQHSARHHARYATRSSGFVDNARLCFDRWKSLPGVTHAFASSNKRRQPGGRN